MTTKTTKTAAAPALAFKLYTTGADIDKAITAVAKRGQALQKELHKVACSVLAHVAQHGNVGIVDKLVKAVPEMGRANALCDWFAAFGPVIFDDERKAAHVKGKATDLRKAMAMPFWQFKPEQAYKPLDVVANIGSMIKRYQDDAKKTGADHGFFIAQFERLKIEAEKRTAH